MPDHLYANVPRATEREPGFQDSSLLWEQGAELSVSLDTQNQPEALLEPVSRRWLATPIAPDSADTLSDWSCPTGQTLTLITPAGGAGVETPSETWTVERDLPTEVNRGFFLDLHLYEPEAAGASWREAVTLEWDDRYRLELRGNETSSSVATLSEKDGDAWRLSAYVALLRGPFFGALHKLWFQPLGADEFLIRNRDHENLGLVVRSGHPYTYDPDAGGDEDNGPPEATAPWGPGTLRVSGKSRGYVVVRGCTYAASWSVATKQPRDLGYKSTQGVTVDGHYWLPDGKRQQGSDGGSEWAATASVLAGELDDDPWLPNGLGQSRYSFRVSVTGPDESGDGFSYRSLVLDRLALDWPRTTADDGNMAVDLLSLPQAVCQLVGLAEDRGPRDSEARLTVSLWGDKAALAPYLRPGQRWQWVVDLADGLVDPETGEPAAESPYIRFDGIRDAADAPQWTRLPDNPANPREWRTGPTVTLRTRWRQADQVMYRGAVPLDGIQRSEAYRRIAAQVPLVVEANAEFEVGALADDAALVPARPGQRPAWQPQVGTTLGDLLRGLAESAGPNDRLRFVDRAGVAKLYVDQPSRTSVATFYRTQADADAAGQPGHVIAGPDDLGLLNLAQDDLEFYNEIIVVGYAPADVEQASGGPAPGQALVAMYYNPSSWQSAVLPDGFGGFVPNPVYVGTRRTLIVVDRALTTQGQVVARAISLVKAFGRFRSAGTLTGYLDPLLYPQDVVTVDPGAEPGAAAVELEIRGMRTQLIQLSLPAWRRYQTVYELGEVATL